MGVYSPSLFSEDGTLTELGDFDLPIVVQKSGVANINSASESD
jgi:hypothetical protein